MGSSTCIASRNVVFTRPDGTFEVAPGAIEVDAGIIARVGRLDAENYKEALQNFLQKSVTPPAPLQDFGDKLVAPAFINAHTHLAMAFFRGLSVETQTSGNVVEDLFFACESSLTEGDVRAFTRMGAYECLLSGTALVWDHYYFGRAVADGLRDVGLCGVVAPTLQDLAGPGMHDARRQLEFTLELDATAGYRNAGIHAALGPHATDTVGPELWRTILGHAQSNNLPVHCHVAQSHEEHARAMARHGCSPVELLARAGLLADGVHFTAVHGIFMSRADLRALHAPGKTLVFCPYSQMIFAFPAQVEAWQDEGLAWCVATDCAASNDSMNVQKELRHVAGIPRASTTFDAAYASFVASGASTDALDAEGARRARQGRSDTFSDSHFLLDKVLSTPGRMHPKFRAGEIAAGAAAHLAVWDFDHPATWPSQSPLRILAMSDVAGSLHNLMCNGTWIGRGGEFAQSILSSENYRDARTEAQARLSQLLARMPH